MAGSTASGLVQPILSRTVIFASLRLAKTGDLKLAQELLGQAKISTTSAIYVHVPEKVAELATEVMAQELSCAQIVPKSKERIN